MLNKTYFHQFFLLALVLIFAAFYWFLDLSLNQQMLFFLASTLSIGMFHGMLDIVLLQQSFIAKSMAKTSLLYALFAILSVLVLLAMPFLTIPILLLISVWHFGEMQGASQSKKTCPIARIVLGGASVAMPYLAAKPALMQLLSTLHLNANALQMAMFVWQFISLFWLTIVILVLLAGVFKVNNWLNKTQWLELAVVALAFVLLPPLLAFSLYFCGYHAFRHIRDVFASSNNFKKQFKWIVLVALASACLLAAVAAFLANKNFAFNTTISSYEVFHATLILLVAVTLPHAFLITLWRKILQHKSL